MVPETVGGVSVSNCDGTSGSCFTRNCALTRFHVRSVTPLSVPTARPIRTISFLSFKTIIITAIEFNCLN